MTSKPLAATSQGFGQGDFISIAPAVCERLLGEPSGRSSREWRWGNKGSFRLKLDTGVWNDFEAGEGGGVLALVMREERLDKARALDWLEQQGFLRRRAEHATNAGIRTTANSSDSPQRAAKNGNSGTTLDSGPIESLRWIRRQILPIADATDHPIRAWMRRRNLWRDEIPLPTSLRWIPSDAPVFRRTHSGVGAIAFPLAPVENWRASYPETPSPSAVQLVCIDAAGERADYENSQGSRVDKPKFGNARLAVWAIGDIRGESVTVCEGAADALALGAREPDPVVAILTTPRPALAWRDVLSVFSTVTLWPDMDEMNMQGRQPGLDSAIALAQARKLSGQSIDVMGVDIGKDAADAARESPLGDIDVEELANFARDLKAEGMAEFEAIRYASTLLK